MGNPFAHKRFSYPADQVFVFDWRDDPRKDQKWYDNQATELEPWILAQEVNRDYAAAVENVVIPSAWVMAAVDFDLAASGIRAAGFDVSGGGPDCNSLIRRHGPVVNAIDRRGGMPTQSSLWARRVCLDEGIEIMLYDSIGVGADVKGVCDLAEEGNTEGLVFRGVNSGSSDLPGIWDEGEDQQGYVRQPAGHDVVVNASAVSSALGSTPAAFAPGQRMS